MKYIIADTDERNSVELKRILDGYGILDFMGSVTSFGALENIIQKEPPDLAFIRMGNSELNAFMHIATIHWLNPLAKIVLYGDQATYAVEAFEYEAAGFIALPFNEKKIELFLLKWLEK